MLISGLDTFFLEVRAHALLKVATETSFSGKNSEHLAFLGYFFRSKNGGKWLLFFFIILEHSYLVQIHAFWKSMHEFLQTIFLWLLAYWQLRIRIKEFHVKIIFRNYKRLSVQLRSSRPELLCKKVFITSENSQENFYAGISLLTKWQTCGL